MALCRLKINYMFFFFCFYGFFYTVFFLWIINIIKLSLHFM
jgi:hypothetical protein